MTQDQVVRAQDVLRSVMAVRRQGRGPLIQRLEQIEPDLTEFLLEELSAIHQLVLSLGGKPRIERRIVRRVEGMAVVLVTSLREAQLRLWQDQAAGTRLAQIDPSLATEPSQDKAEPDTDGPAADG